MHISWVHPTDTTGTVTSRSKAVLLTFSFFWSIFFVFFSFFSSMSEQAALEYTLPAVLHFLQAEWRRFELLKELN